MTFAAMLLLSLAAAAWLSRPWWAGFSARTQGRRQANIAAYRQRLGEIERDIETGLLAPDAAESLRQELAARLLADTGDLPAVAAPGARRPLVPWITALLLLVFAGGAYYFQGSWQLAGIIQTAASDPAAAERSSLALTVRQLEKHLDEQPDDIEGWAALGRAYSVQKRYADAASAYHRANERNAQEDPDLLVAEGEALGNSQGQQLAGAPQELFQRALTLAPEHSKALLFGGLAALQAKQYAEAQALWSRLYRQELPQLLRDTLDQRLHELAKLTGTPAPEPEPELAAAASELALQVQVRLAEPLRGRVPAGATLFVFARAAQGPPMPLAVYRGMASELPTEVRLDDSMAMTPQLKLSTFDHWTLTARISASGQAQPQSGDLEGSLDVSSAMAGAPLLVEIDRLVP